MKATNPDGLFVLAAQEAGNDDLKTSVQKLINTKYDPSFNQEPADTRPVPVNGQTWTQFLYKLPSDQLLAVVATKQKETVYFVVLQAKLADMQTLTPKFNDLLLNFKIKQ